MRCIRYYSDSNQDYRDAQYTIFLAEVASTLNEALAHGLYAEEIDRSEGKNVSAYVLCGSIPDDGIPSNDVRRVRENHP